MPGWVAPTLALILLSPLSLLLLAEPLATRLSAWREQRRQPRHLAAPGPSMRTQDHAPGSRGSVRIFPLLRHAGRRHRGEGASNGDVSRHAADGSHGADQNIQPKSKEITSKRGVPSAPEKSIHWLV